MTHYCHNPNCQDEVPPARAALGYDTCLTCGEAQAKAARKSWCVAPAYNKGAYQLITDPKDLWYTNPRRTT